MIAYQQVIDEIRMLLQMPDQQQADTVRRLGTQYNSACQEVNGRLNQCANLMAKGLRSEAIHVAQAEPILLDVVAGLDFPERKHWEQLCATHNIALPQPLNLEVASLLNEAYADDQPLDELLRKHRLLNLGRAPLSARLGLLRRLAELDSRNPTWEDDVKTFERARLQQIQNNIDLLVQQQNAGAVLAVANELSNANWRVSPPAPLVTKVQTAAKRFGDMKTLGILREVEAKLNDAMAACDVPRAITLRDQWNRLVATSRPSPGDPIWNRVSVVLSWVDQQANRQADEAAYQEAVSRLESLVNVAGSVDTLEKQYQEVLRFNRGIPETLQAKYQAATKRLRSAARRRRFVRVAVPVLAIGLVLAGVVWWLNFRSQNQKVNDAIQAMNQFLEAGQVAEAKAYLVQVEQGDPVVAQNRDIQALKVRIQIAEREEEERRLAFKESFKAAQTAGLDQAGDQIVQKAVTLAKVPEEQAALQRLLQQRKEKKVELAQDKGKQIVVRADQLSRDMDELEATLKKSYDPTAIAKVLNEKRGSANDLLTEASTADSDPKMKEKAQSLFDRVEAARAFVQQSNAEALFLAELTYVLEKKGGLPAYVAAIEKFVSSFSDTPRGKAFKNTLTEKDLWEAAVAWNRLLATTQSKPLDIKTADASKLVEQVRQYLKDYPRSPYAPQADNYLKGLQALSLRNEADPKSAAAEFRRVFGALAIKDVWFLKTVEGKVYYSTEDIPKVLRSQTGFNYLIGYDGKTKTLSGTSVRNLKAGLKTGRSPQALIADEVAYLSEGFAERRWDESILKTARQVRESADMDPILKMILLRQVIECGTRGSYPLSVVLASHVEEFQNARVDITVPWLDPDSDPAVKQRPLAREFINLLAPIPTLEKCDAVKNKLAADLLGGQRFVAGCLGRTGTEWTIAYSVSPAVVDSCNLYVIVPGVGEQPATWHQIGDVAKGKTTIHAADAKALGDGRLVFAAPRK